LNQNPTFWEKVEPKLQPMVEKIEPKPNLLGKGQMK
jgi:hypothetical protein